VIVNIWPSCTLSLIVPLINGSMQMHEKAGLYCVHVFLTKIDAITLLESIVCNSFNKRQWIVHIIYVNFMTLLG
jgi:hypothetical protein